MSRVSINQPAPDFSLSDFSGTTFHHKDFIGRKSVPLVFNRTLFDRSTKNIWRSCVRTIQNLPSMMLKS